MTVLAFYGDRIGGLVSLVVCGGVRDDGIGWSAWLTGNLGQRFGGFESSIGLGCHGDSSNGRSLDVWCVFVPNLGMSVMKV